MRSSQLANLDREILQTIAKGRGVGWTDNEREYAAMLAKRPTYEKLRADNKALLDALNGLLYRHADKSDEHGSWAEWDTAQEAIAQATSAPQEHSEPQ